MQNTTKSEPQIFQAAFIATTIFCFIATFIISFGNFALLYALYKNLKYDPRNPSLPLYINLIFSDFLTGFVVGSLTTADAYIDVFGKNSVALDSCLFLFGGLLMFVNNLTITSISVLRLIAVVKPLLYRCSITAKRIRLLIVFIWLFSFLICLLPAFRLPQWIVILIYSHSHATIPIVILTSVYLVILRSLKKQRRYFLNMHERMEDTMLKKRIERDHSLIVTIAMVLVLFCLSSFPFVIGVHVLTYIQNCDNCLSEFAMRMITSGIYFSGRCVLLNSALDPFLLTVRMPKIREAVRKTYARHLCLFSKSMVLPQPKKVAIQSSNDKQETAAVVLQKVHDIVNVTVHDQ
ncbi:adrenocorticotropic hormone receptor-like [Actinia tenebrosa]|uniref:Adrenocorticotropic hormone receptor-like n=1 Tax=Actinia tenebrosa TaxID=6105 RepID=A0A6P8HKU8_ACTTE|nr:adrenocorticotropic hormone receptor-like [Actinia tenebrosa]